MSKASTRSIAQAKAILVSFVSAEALLLGNSVAAPRSAGRFARPIGRFTNELTLSIWRCAQGLRVSVSFFHSFSEVTYVYSSCKARLWPRRRAVGEQAKRGFYSCRAVGGDRHHRDFDRPVVAGR